MIDHKYELLREAMKLKIAIVETVNSLELTDEEILTAFKDIQLIEHSAYFLKKIIENRVKQ
jgi:hypothetical protein